jgi:hypothetical protein
VGAQQRGEDAQQGGLAGAVRAEDAERLAGLDGEGHACQCGPLAVAPPDVVEL